jgi:hypothetical protein
MFLCKWRKDNKNRAKPIKNQLIEEKPIEGVVASGIGSIAEEPRVEIKVEENKGGEHP